MGRQFQPGIILILLMAFLLPSCTKNDVPLTISIHKWPGYELIFLAKNMGWINNNLQLHETNSASTSLEALREGKVDGAALTLDEVLRARAEGIALTVVMIFDISAGADALMAKPGIKTLKDLKGKRIGYEKSAVGALVLYKVLHKAGLSNKDVQLKEYPISEHITAWNEGRIDAVISYDPVIYQLGINGAVKLFDSREMPEMIFDVLAIRTEVLDKQKENIKDFTRNHFRALEHLLHFPQDAGYRMAERLGVAGDEIRNVFRGIELPNSKANQNYLSGNNSRFLQAAKNVDHILFHAGLLTKEGSFENLSTDMYIVSTNED